VVIVPFTAVRIWASSVVGEKLVVLKVTMVASPSTDKLMNEALSLLTLLVENTNSLLVAGPHIDWMNDIYNMLILYILLLNLKKLDANAIHASASGVEGK
jgi:hypothetical protein